MISIAYALLIDYYKRHFLISTFFKNTKYGEKQNRTNKHNAELQRADSGTKYTR